LDVALDIQFGAVSRKRSAGRPNKVRIVALSGESAIGSDYCARRAVPIGVHYVPFFHNDANRHSGTAKLDFVSSDQIRVTGEDSVGRRLRESIGRPGDQCQQGQGACKKGSCYSCAVHFLLLKLNQKKPSLC
jgi:hypothetical protein